MTPVRPLALVVVIIIAPIRAAHAEPPAASPTTSISSVEPVDIDDPYVIEIQGEAPVIATVEQVRAFERVDAEALERAQPRTTAEALRLTPGVSVQKTNHAGGSPFLRGLTGQKTVLLVDGFRLGTSIMRPGPSQYLNTVPAGAVDAIDVVRGASSVLYGSDAIGGAIHLHTRPAAEHATRATVTARGASAERSAGGRAELGGQLGPVAVRGGVSASAFGDLRGAGPIDGAAAVPIYDGDQQLYTGYREAAGDVRATWSLPGDRELRAAAIAYRQFGAPRTDKCSPVECLVFDEQFYDLTYLRYRGDHGRLGAVEAGVAVARTHERRSNRDTAVDTIERELDVVWSVSGLGRAALPTWRVGPSRVRLTTGVDLQAEYLASQASVDTDEMTVPRARGKFLDGSRIASAAGFALADASFGRAFGVTTGVRVSVAAADIPRDPDSGAAGFRSRIAVPVASVGARLRLVGPVYAVANLDQGYRAPNLYDLTAQTGGSGPGYQLPNPALDAESSVTAELGLKVDGERVQLGGFVYHTTIDDFIAREPAACPSALSDRCGDAEAVYRAVNADSAQIRGVEVSAATRVGPVVAHGSVTWTRGDRTLDAAQMSEPLPKIPPAHGVIALRRESPRWFAELVGRWALAQRRLAPRDVADRRIPDGGTPGYAVVDARIGGQLHRDVRATLTIENMLDRPYRVHGSGVDGAGFGAIVTVTGSIR